MSHTYTELMTEDVPMIVAELEQTHGREVVRVGFNGMPQIARVELSMLTPADATATERELTLRALRTGERLGIAPGNEVYERLRERLLH